MKKMLLVMVFFVYTFTFLGAKSFDRVDEQELNDCVWLEFNETSLVERGKREIINKALINPEQVFMLDYSVIDYERINLFFHRTIKEYTKLIKFSNGKFYVANTFGQEFGEKTLSWYIIFLLIFIVSVIFINISSFQKGILGAIGYIGLCFGMITAILTPAFIDKIFIDEIMSNFLGVNIARMMMMLFIATIVFESKKMKKVHIIFTIILYVLAIILLFYKL